MTTATDLKSIGLKATLPRMKILELFQSGQHRHLSAEDVYKLLLQEDLDIGLATVYRVLTQFEQARGARGSRRAGEPIRGQGDFASGEN